MAARRIFLSLFLLFVLGALAFWAWAWNPAIAAIEPPTLSSFDASLISRGAQLVLIGNCNVCHTTPEGKSFAGGRPQATPFGTIYSTNITPDPDTGIGRWSEFAFRRSMREGLDREGRHLYPAFPYDHFTKITDEDITAIYAFMMTREPVYAETPANKLAFPFSIRALVAGWKLLFFDRGVFQPDPSKDEELNRGAYLVEGLGHCGACHTPRNLLGAENMQRKFAGGEAEDWDTPALNASPPSGPWTREHLLAYLRSGLDGQHDAAAGPMASVVRNLSQVNEQNLRAISSYIALLPERPSFERQGSSGGTFALARRNDTTTTTGEADALAKKGSVIFAEACTDCHENELSQSTSVSGPQPRNAIHVILEGLQPTNGEPGVLMPAYSITLTDNQIATLVIYMRTQAGIKPPWSSVEDEVRRIRAGKK
jgi:mono/diheme cytochrome c family protein